MRSVIYWGGWSIQTLVIFLIWIDIIPMPQSKLLSVWSIFIVLFISHFFTITPQLKYLGMSHVHFLYAALCAFGLDWMYTLVGAFTVDHIRAANVLYISSPQYPRAIILSMLAFMSYPVGCYLGIKYRKINKNNMGDERLQKNFASVSLLLLFLSVLFFAYMLLSGVITIGMDYSVFREVAYDNPFYSWVILTYSIGICWAMSCCTDKQKKIAWALFVFSAIIFFLTGNKGEVLYALLTVVAIMRYNGLNISLKLFIALAFIAFIVIPIVTSSRHQGGVFENIDDVALNFSGFFTELGMQLRCTVIILDDYAKGVRDFLWGYSYYGPIFNHIPGLHIANPKSFDFKEAFEHMGFNQIAEGYANFGTVGSIAYFTITSWFLSKNESSKMSMPELALIGAICSEMVNISRNKFLPFFPHIAIILILYYFVIFFSKHQKKIL